MPPPPDGRSRLPTNVFEPRTSTPLWKSALTADPIRLGLPAHAPPPEALRPGSSITFAPTDPNGIEEFHVRIRDDAGRRFDWVVPSSGNIEEE